MSNNKGNTKVSADAESIVIGDQTTATATNSAVLPMSADLSKFFDQIRLMPDAFMAPPEGILQPDVLALFGHGDTLETSGKTSNKVTFDFRTARPLAGTKVSADTANKGKIIPNVLCEFTTGKYSGKCRLSAGQAQDIINGGAASHNCTVTYTANAKTPTQPYTNFAVGSAA